MRLRNWVQSFMLKVWELNYLEGQGDFVSRLIMGIVEITWPIEAFTYA